MDDWLLTLALIAPAAGIAALAGRKIYQWSLKKQKTKALDQQGTAAKRVGILAGCGIFLILLFTLLAASRLWFSDSDKTHEDLARAYSSCAFDASIEQSENTVMVHTNTIQAAMCVANELDMPEPLRDQISDEIERGATGHVAFGEFDARVMSSEPFQVTFSSNPAG